MNGLLLAAGPLATFCHDTHDILQLIGWGLTVFKIAIALIIIVVGLIDLGKAAISDKPEEVKKCVTSLIYRIVGGVAIFFVPIIVTTVFGWITGWSDIEKGVDWNVCEQCISNPWSNQCK